MTRHLRLECGVPPQFKCPFCDYFSCRKGNVNAHMVYKHGPKEFSCFACNSKHPTKASLMLHMSHSCKVVNNDTKNDYSTSINSKLLQHSGPHVSFQVLREK